jgi:hypothetical protein
MLGDSVKVDYIGGYHVDNVAAGQVNGNIRRTFYVKPKAADAISIVESSKLLRAYQSGKIVYIQSQTEAPIYIKLYGITGKLLKQTEATTEFKLPDDLSNGVYVVRISSGKVTQTLKVVI